MSELRHLANSQSPLFNTLQSFSSNDAFEYEIAKSYPNVVKTRVELNMDSNASLGGQVVMALPKYGLLYKAVIKTRLKVPDDLTLNHPVFPIRGLGAHLIDRASWMVHNKTIEQQTPQSCEAYMLSLPANEQEALRQIMRYDLGAAFSASTTFAEGGATSTLFGEQAVANSDWLDVYTPLFFSFSHNSKQAVDLTFLQSTNLVFTYASATSLHDRVRGEANRVYAEAAANTIKIVPESSKVILYYYQMPNDTMKEIERTLFDATTPLTLLGKSYFAETEKVQLADSGAVAYGEQSITVDLNCKNCVYQTVICVRAENATTKTKDYDGGSYVPLKNIELKIGGRSIWSVGAEELNMIDNSWGSGNNPLSNVFASAGVSGNLGSENMYLVNHGVVPSSHSQNTGCLSLKNCSSPQLIITFANIGNADATTNYRCMVGHFHYNLITQSGLDGAVQVGISL